MVVGRPIVLFSSWFFTHDANSCVELSEIDCALLPLAARRAKRYCVPAWAGSRGSWAGKETLDPRDAERSTRREAQSSAAGVEGDLLLIPIRNSCVLRWRGKKTRRTNNRCVSLSSGGRSPAVKAI